MPYLPQGTACPLKIKVIDIAGKANRQQVVRDLVWEADMCFTKPDIGMSLPWVLHVSDVGALAIGPLVPDHGHYSVSVGEQATDNRPFPFFIRRIG